MNARRQVAFATAFATLALTGCRGCGDEAKTAPASAQASASSAVAAPDPATAVAAPAPATPAYDGPSSKAADGYQLSTGFLDVHNKPLPQPKAGEQTAIYTTALDPAGHPLGTLEPLGSAEMFGFLVARDLRHTLVASAAAPVREGADARALTFAPPGGGDHALVAVFRAQGGAAHAVISPVSVAGSLPQLMGPGLNGLGLRADTSQEHVELLLLPADRTPTAPLDLQLQDVDSQGRHKGPVTVPFAVLVDPPMGRARVLEPSGEPPRLHWEAPEPGEWLVLIAPKKGDRALAFHLTIPNPSDKK